MNGYTVRPAIGTEWDERCECDNCGNCADYVVTGPRKDGTVGPILYCSLHLAALRTVLSV